MKKHQKTHFFNKNTDVRAERNSIGIIHLSRSQNFLLFFKKKDAIQNMWEEIIESLDIVENCNFIRGRTEAAIRDCSHENTCNGV